MVCYTEENMYLGTVSTIVKIGEEHMFGDELFICTKTETECCRIIAIFKKA